MPTRVSRQWRAPLHRFDFWSQGFAQKLNVLEGSTDMLLSCCQTYFMLDKRNEDNISFSWHLKTLIARRFLSRAALRNGLVSWIRGGVNHCCFSCRLFYLRFAVFLTPNILVFQQSQPEFINRVLDIRPFISAGTHCMCTHVICASIIKVQNYFRRVPKMPTNPKNDDYIIPGTRHHTSTTRTWYPYCYTPFLTRLVRFKLPTYRRYFGQYTVPTFW